MSTILERYIRSKTKVFAVDDIRRYQLGGICESLCPFCNEPHNDIIIVSDGIDTSTHSCKECSDVINYSLRQSSTDTVGKAVKEVRLRNLLGVLDDVPLIADDIVNHLQHFQPAYKDVFAGRQKFCYVCQREAVSSMYNTRYLDLLPIPQRAGNLIGGLIGVCDREFCDKVLEEYNLKLEGQVDKEIFYKISCQSCKSPYYIHHSEYNYRKKFSFSTFECAVCTYQRINSYEFKQPELYPGIIGEPRIEIFSRFIEKTCNICCEYDSIDLSQTAFSLAFNNQYNDKIVCGECGSLRKWLDNGRVFRPISETSYWMELFIGGTFSLYNVKRGNLDVLMINEETNEKEPLNQITVAYEKIYDYLNGEKNDL